MQVFIEHAARSEPLPVVASLPHSGTFVPDAIAQGFTSEHARWLKHTDWFLPSVYEFLPDLGVSVLEATHSRYVVDLNRDPKRALFGPFFSAVIAERTPDGRAIYRQRPERSRLEARIAEYHGPFHQRLSRLLGERLARFGRVWLLDLHSFIEPIQSDVCLGDAEGQSCSPKTTQLAQAAFRHQGFETVVNAPFSGGYVVRRHGIGSQVEALQIELRYSTYMDVSNIQKPPMPTLESLRLAEVQPRLRRVFERLLAELL